MKCISNIVFVKKYNNTVIHALLCVKLISKMKIKDATYICPILIIG